ncbi:MAG: hypothetical protein V4505_02720 [Pseudomonadota bacterium]
MQKKLIVPLALALLAPLAAFSETWKPVTGTPTVQIDVDSRAQSDVTDLVNKNYFSANVRADLPDDKRMLITVVYDCAAKAPTLVGQRITAQALVDGKMADTETQVAKVTQPVAPNDLAGKMAYQVACQKK